MAQNNLYFIALIPSQEVIEQVMYFKKDMARRFQSKAALKVVPHITLIVPFHLVPQDHKALVECFGNLNISVEPFNVQLQDFGAFPKNHSPVIFIHPVANTALHNLQREIIRSFHENCPGIPIADIEEIFHPHMTIAYRDLKPEMFKIAWQEYSVKKYSASFLVENFHLLQHDGTKWNVIETKFL